MKSLQTDYIDLYYLHADDPKREVGEIIETLNSFVREGKVRYFSLFELVGRKNVGCRCLRKRA